MHNFFFVYEVLDSLQVLVVVLVLAKPQLPVCICRSPAFRFAREVWCTRFSNGSRRSIPTFERLCLVSDNSKKRTACFHFARLTSRPAPLAFDRPDGGTSSSGKVSSFLAACFVA